jgi:uncharacterized phiE125 gp8 family phage protein
MYTSQKRGLKRTVEPTSEPVTTAEAKTHLRVDHSDDDTYIASLISAARTIAENYTNRSFFTQTWVKTMSYFPYPEVLELQRGYVQSVSSLKYYDESNSQQTWNSANYTVNTSGDIAYLEADTDFPSDLYDRTDAVEVTYLTGWDDVADIPAAIKHAVLMIVGHLYENRQDVVVGSQVNQMPKSSEYLLDPYKIHFIDND